MRHAIWLLFFVFAPLAHGQLVQILLKEPRLEKNYAKWTTKIGATTCIVGEIKAGIKYDDHGTTYTQGKDPLNEIWVGDPGEPGTPPYSIDPKTMGKEKNKRAKLGYLAMPGDDILGVKMLDRYRTYVGVAADYQRSMDEIQALQKERDTKQKTERAWFDNHGRMLGKMDQLSIWLTNLGYGVRSKEIEKDMEKQRKSVGKAAENAREKAAVASIKMIWAPQKLIDVSNKVGAGKFKWMVQESQHVRFTYINSISDADVTAALELAEHVINGFLREAVDPYLDDQFTNYIPDGLFHEFYYGPEDPAIHGKMLTEYYGLEWGINKADELKAEGADYYRKEAPWYFSYRKVVKEIDLPGYTVHEIGHSLMDLNYNKGGRNDTQDWLREAVGYYVSLNYLGRNGLVCFSTSEENYAKMKQEAGVKTAQNGIGDVMNQVALKLGPAIDTLAVKRLWQINDADFAKSWSFYDYLMRKRGKAGQVWLRETCAVASDPKGNLARDWRKPTEAFEPVNAGEDVFQALEKDWKKFAVREQTATVPSTKK